MNKWKLFDENDKSTKEINYQILDKANTFTDGVLANKSKKFKTNQIKRFLVDLGHINNFNVYANGFSKEEVEDISKSIKGTFVNREWLFDVHWYSDVDGKKYSPEEFILACECEWGKGKQPTWNTYEGALGYDFQKLLFCNAKLKLFICKVKYQKDLDYLRNYIEDSIAGFKQLAKDSEFLIICYCKEVQKMFYLTVFKK